MYLISRDRPMTDAAEEYPKFSPMKRASFRLMIGSFAFSMQGQSEFSKSLKELMAAGFPDAHRRPALSAVQR